MCINHIQLSQQNHILGSILQARAECLICTQCSTRIQDTTLNMRKLWCSISFGTINVDICIHVCILHVYKSHTAVTVVPRISAHCLPVNACTLRKQKKVPPNRRACFRSALKASLPYHNTVRFTSRHSVSFITSREQKSVPLYVITITLNLLHSNFENNIIS